MKVFQTRLFLYSYFICLIFCHFVLICWQHCVALARLTFEVIWVIVNMSHVDLGYVEKCEPWLLQSHFFPSKVGGKPAWLALKNLPTPEEQKCQLCNKPMVFLCQVYAPVEGDDSCFHRTLFLFVCRDASCSVTNDSRNFVAWRCQLRRENEFYSPEPPVESLANVFDVGQYVTVCTVCGCGSSKHCGKCKVVSYCSREHQVADWKAGHKQACGQAAPRTEDGAKVLFEEFELMIEQEEQDKAGESDDEAEEKRLKDYQRLVEEGKAGTMSEVPDDELESHAAVDADEAFLEFRRRTAKSPEQVLRYDRGGEPLWVASEPRPSEIPACDHCKGPRHFEFQVLPQLLYSLHESRVDWGTVAVYTCRDNCAEGAAYKREFVFKQDVSK